MEAPDRTKRSASVQDKVPQPPAIEENVFTGDPNLPHPPMDSASGHLTDYNHQQSKPVSENLMNQSEENSSNKSQGNTDQTSHVSTPGMKGPVK